MPWAGNYYYRSERVNGQPRRMYVGTGLAAQLAAQLDDIAREQQALDRAQAERLRAEAQELDDQVGRVDELAELLCRAAMLAAGYHRHHRGEWRKRRGTTKHTPD